MLQGKRGSSFLLPSALRSRLPHSEEVFREGYVYKKKESLLTTSWPRTFLVLQSGNLTFYSSWDLLRDTESPLMSFRLTASSGISQSSTKTKEFVIKDEESSVTICLSTDSIEQTAAWVKAVAMEIEKRNGFVDVEPPLVRARFFEGPLFKTPPEPTKWEERWFELTGDGELSYWQSHGVNKKGIIDLETCKVVPNKTDAPGICTPFIFQIHAFVCEPTDGKKEYVRRTFNLAAPTQVDYLNWLKALKMWIGVKRGTFLNEEDRQLLLERGSLLGMDNRLYNLGARRTDLGPNRIPALLNVSNHVPMRKTDLGPAIAPLLPHRADKVVPTVDDVL